MVFGYVCVVCSACAKFQQSTIDLICMYTHACPDTQILRKVMNFSIWKVRLKCTVCPLSLSLCLSFSPCVYTNIYTRAYTAQLQAIADKFCANLNEEIKINRTRSKKCVCLSMHMHFKITACHAKASLVSL